MATATASDPPTRSLRQRLIAGIVIAVCLAAFAEALLLHLVWSEYERRLIDEVVTDELNRSVELHARAPALAHPGSEDLRLFVLVDDETLASDALPPSLEPLRTLRSNGTGVSLSVFEALDGVTYQIGLLERGTQRFVMVYDAREHTQRRRDVLWAVLAIAAILTLAAARLALGWVDHLLGGLSRLQYRVARGSDAERFFDVRMDAEVAALAQALDDQRQQVIGALRKERAFAAAASHELRTPLTRITTGSQVLLARSDLPSGVDVRLQSINEAAQELQRLLDVLLEVARWQPSGASPRPLAPVGLPETLGDIIARCLRTLASEARLLGSKISTEIQNPEKLIHQPAMLEVVLTNLLRNAIRHGRQAPIRVLGTDQEILVEDAGPGIEAGALERVFDPFWQGSTPQDETGPHGLGLGLTITERICAAAGWTLRIESEPGVGTRARVGFGPVR